MSAEERTWFLACIVLGAVLATLLMGSGCGARQAVEPPMRVRDGLWIDLIQCEDLADVSATPQATYDKCLVSRGL